MKKINGRVYKINETFSNMSTTLGTICVCIWKVSLTTYPTTKWLSQSRTLCQKFIQVEYLLQAQGKKQHFLAIFFCDKIRHYLLSRGISTFDEKRYWH